MADKLDTYRNTYKEAEGNSAVSAIPGEVSSDPAYQPRLAPGTVTARSLDSIDRVMQARFPVPGNSGRLSGSKTYRAGPDHQVASAIAELNRQGGVPRKIPVAGARTSEKDPMEVFKQQMAYMDSMGKANDPDLKAARLKADADRRSAALKAGEVKLTVVKADAPSGNFNTVMPKNDASFISAAIDENITGYAGSRIKLKLLEAIKAGGILVPKGTYLYAQITGFNEQRVALTVTSILLEGKILPVKLQAYDLDGMSGLYVPSSTFREFTKDLGSSSVQGVTLDGGSGNNQFIMSTAGKFFQSTSSAIADLIRKNKARLKYNSYLYLIDNEALQSAQKKY